MIRALAGGLVRLAVSVVGAIIVATVAMVMITAWGQHFVQQLGAR